MKRRVLLVPLLLAAHLAVLGLALRPLHVDAGSPPGQALRVVEVAAAPVPVVVPPAPPVPVDAAVAVQVEAPVVETAPEIDLVGAGPSDCALTDAIQAALRTDSATAQALGKVPPASRSVANAVMIWDGRWATGATSALAPIQRIVVASIRAAPAACQAAAITGPRLIMVPDGSGSAVLAFGSGVWSWAQLLT
jgi:hypothetical protein